MAHDNFSEFAKLLDKHLYFLPAGFNEGYDNKFTRYAQIYVIINMHLVDFFKKGIHDNETKNQLNEYASLVRNASELESLTKEREIINYLLELDKLN